VGDFIQTSAKGYEKIISFADDELGARAMENLLDGG
jgi:hypothetical protein